MPLRRGFFITLEGPEGSGKSSQSRWLVQALRRAGFCVLAIRDPGSTAIGRALRRVLLHSSTPLSPIAEALLFIGGRVQLIEELIEPALKQGLVVVCDRFHDATMAYQGFAGRLNVRWLDQLGRRAIHRRMPALTILLDLPPEAGFARLRRAHDRMERKAKAFHRRVREGYLTLAAREPKRFVVVNALQSCEAIRAQLRAIVLNRIMRTTRS